MTKANQKRERNLQIEGLRGLAILIIVTFHAFCRYKQIFLNSNITWMDDFGTFGVGIFMMITGYYLVDFNSKDTKKFSFFQYLKQRIIRLWPCYAICITITAFTIHLFYLPNRMTSWKDWILNIFFINGFIGKPYVDGAHWYLTTLLSITIVIGIAKKLKVETNPYFYIFWMVIIALAKLLNISIISQCFGGSYIGYVCTVLSIKSVANSRNNSLIIKMMWIISFCIGVLSIFYWVGGIAALQLIIIIPLFFGAVLYKVPLFQNKIFLFLGNISYSLYLIHQNITFEIEYYLTQLIGRYSYLYGFFAIIIVTIIAYIINRYVEVNLKIDFKYN